MSFSISADCQGQEACWQINNTGQCHLYSRLYFHKNGEIKYGLEVNKINMTDMRSDVISVISNDTIISLYGVQQSFAEGNRMELLIVRKSIADVIADFERTDLKAPKK